MHVDWQGFEKFLAARGDQAGPRVAYLDGLLELMAPSRTHEDLKKRIALLVEAWSQENGIEIQAYGSWLLKRKRRRTGVEPDECYVLGNPSNPKAPDLAIEVVWTVGAIDKLETFRRMSVREVWIWEDGELDVYALRRGRYARARASRLFPTLDLSLLTEHALRPNQFQAVQAWRALFRRH